MTKKITALILLLALCICCLCACGEDDGIPDGMYDVALEGEPFILYVPGSWTDNRDSGISSAYYSINNAITVSARYYTPDGDISLTEYVNSAEATYTSELKDYKRSDRNEKSLLGEKTAVRLQYTFDKNGESITVLQYYAEQGEGEHRIIIMLSIYYSTASLTDEYSEMFDQIVTEFRFRDGFVVSDEKVDKNTPEGMKIASAETAEYLFYVPKSWKCNSADKHCSAYYPDANRSNVSVTSFAPSERMTAEEYFKASEEIYKTDIQGYERLGESDVEISGIASKSYEYKAVYDGVEYMIRQTVVSYADLIYSITYTSLAEVYVDHIIDVDVMLASFRFR